MEKVEVGTRGASSQVLEIEKLNETMEKQRREIARLRNLLDLTGAGTVLGFGFKIRSFCWFFPFSRLICYQPSPCLIYRAVIVSLISKELFPVYISTVSRDLITKREEIHFCIFKKRNVYKSVSFSGSLSKWIAVGYLSSLSVSKHLLPKDSCEELLQSSALVEQLLYFERERK